MIEVMMIWTCPELENEGAGRLCSGVQNTNEIFERNKDAITVRLSDKAKFFEVTTKNKIGSP